MTNGEFLQFVESGGYQNKDLWTDEGITCIYKCIVMCNGLCLGWKWVQFRCARHPTFWVCSEGCKSGCGADLASYSHCNLPSAPSASGTKYRYAPSM